MALPWAARATPPPPERDALRDAAANLALLGAARALTRHDPDCQRSAEEVVADALRGMTPQGRIEAAARVHAATEHIHAKLRELHSARGPLSADDVRRAFLGGAGRAPP
jgi:hypothetical protein